ncbi:MAG: hypothetical protein JST75_10345 [Bacteroidetes bacterium]|nr:hypothetical protein [Bacteroidota bacterium]
MKKNMSVIVLLIEIAAISILHAVKIKQSEKTSQYNVAAAHSSAQDADQKIKSSYILAKMVK